ncbi:chemotaxis protein CheY [Pandoraea thiooxydans]|nr:chemotaxis protein CheY [Pandoraea thiooxydans]
MIRESLAEAIDASGVFIVAGTADTASEAVTLLKEQAFDAIIVDLQLRQGSGIEVLAYLREAGLHRSMLSIVLTNYALPALRQRCLDCGAGYFFDKSLEFDRVIEVMDEFASRRLHR